MPTAKTLTLFLMDGSPAGRIKCTLANWTGEVYLIPRTDLAKSKDREILKQTGVYILLGTEETTGEEKAYIGQARERKNQQGVLGRIIEHVGEERNDYFTHAIVIVSSNNSFGPTEISYLEHTFHQDAVNAGRVHTTNNNDPSRGHVTEEKEAELQEFIQYAKIAIRSLGYRLFDAVDDAKSPSEKPEPKPASIEPTLYLNERGVTGTGRQTADGFVVHAGSKIREKTTSSASKSTLDQRKKYRNRTSPDGFLQQDTLFSSPSAASAFLVGSSSNGRTAWKDEHGITLKELEQRELESVETEIEDEDAMASATD